MGLDTIHVVSVADRVHCGRSWRLADEQSRAREDSGVAAAALRGWLRSGAVLDGRRSKRRGENRGGGVHGKWRRTAAGVVLHTASVRLLCCTTGPRTQCPRASVRSTAPGDHRGNLPATVYSLSPPSQEVLPIHHPTLRSPSVFPSSLSFLPAMMHRCSHVSGLAGAPPSRHPMSASPAPPSPPHDAPSGPWPCPGSPPSRYNRPCHSPSPGFTFSWNPGPGSYPGGYGQGPHHGGHRHGGHRHRRDNRAGEHYPHFGHEEQNLFHRHNNRHHRHHFVPHVGLLHAGPFDWSKFGPRPFGHPLQGERGWEHHCSYHQEPQDDPSSDSSYISANLADIALASSSSESEGEEAHATKQAMQGLKDNKAASPADTSESSSDCEPSTRSDAAADQHVHNSGKFHDHACSGHMHQHRHRYLHHGPNSFFALPNGSAADGSGLPVCPGAPILHPLPGLTHRSCYSHRHGHRGKAHGRHHHEKLDRAELKMIRKDEKRTAHEAKRAKHTARYESMCAYGSPKMNDEEWASLKATYKAEKAARRHYQPPEDPVQSSEHPSKEKASCESAATVASAEQDTGKESTATPPGFVVLP